MENITALTSSMNRNQFLKNTIDKCQNINNLDSHIIIDYSSTTPVEDALNVNYDNLIIYRVEDQKVWSISRAYNAGFSLVETEYILKIDADVEINFVLINTFDYENYDLIIFSHNENDVGNWLMKKKLIENVNGFNEFLFAGYDDHDLIKRVRSLNPNLKEIIVKDGITKIEHSNELRVPHDKSLFLKKDENYFYAIKKAYNDYSGYISKNNFWSKNNARNYKINKNTIQINHFYSHKDTGLTTYIMCKYIFLSTFFRIYFKESNNLFLSIYKRVMPFVLLPLTLRMLKNIFGFDVFPLSIQIDDI